MDEQTYKELTAAVKESGIPLDYQEELQGLLDEEYFKDKNKEQKKKYYKKKETQQNLQTKNGTYWQRQAKTNSCVSTTTSFAKGHLMIITTMTGKNRA